MSRKDYKAVADMLAQLRSEHGEDGEPIIAVVQSRLAALFLAENPRFDPYRFGKACVKQVA